MKNWELLINQGRDAYSEERFNQALSINQNAIEIALNLFDNVFELEPERAVAAVVISYFNIADTYIALNSWSSAQQALEQASLFLQKQFSCLFLSEPQQVALLHAASHLRIEWASLIQKSSAATAATHQSPPVMIKEQQAIQKYNQ
ncbi:hypothetical protein [Neptunomonas sp.]|uniref:hypothetical protein n=1 Tax=Neptunomonas TaxID=75687 RepID=UPI00351874F3